MKTIKYSPALLVDFNKLLIDFKCFMSFNLIHGDQGVDIKYKAKMVELIKYSLKNCAILADLFKEPLLSHEKENKQILIKNFVNILTFCKNYLDYAGPILQKSRADIYQGRYKDLEKHYKEFSVKYNI